MPLDTATLQSTLITAFKHNLLPGSISTKQEEDISNLAESITNAMKVFVQSATITYTTGLTTAPGGGPVTGVFTNIIS